MSGTKAVVAIIISAIALVLALTLLILYFVQPKTEQGPKGEKGDPGPSGDTQFKWNIIRLSIPSGGGNSINVKPQTNTMYIIPSDAKDEFTITIDKGDMFSQGSSIIFNGSFCQAKIQIKSTYYKNPPDGKTDLTLTLYKHDCVTYTLSDNPSYPNILYRMVDEVDTSHY